MSQIANELVELVEFIVTPLVSNPDAIKVDYQFDSDDELLINIEVDSEDCGKIIGRQGRVIKSIRTLVRAAASRHDLDANVEIVD